MASFEFTWCNDEERLQRFGTSCPTIGEVFMRSLSDFPQLSRNSKEFFYRLYGQERGKFENFLRREIAKPHLGELHSGIPGLTIRYSE